MKNTITPSLSYNSIGHVIYEMSSGHVLSPLKKNMREWNKMKSKNYFNSYLI